MHIGHTRSGNGQAILELGAKVRAAQCSGDFVVEQVRRVGLDDLDILDAAAVGDGIPGHHDAVAEYIGIIYRVPTCTASWIDGGNRHAANALRFAEIAFEAFSVEFRIRGKSLPCFGITFHGPAGIRKGDIHVSQFHEQVTVERDIRLGLHLVYRDCLFLHAKCFVGKFLSAVQGCIPAVSIDQKRVCLTPRLLNHAQGGDIDRMFVFESTGAVIPVSDLVHCRQDRWVVFAVLVLVNGNLDRLLKFGFLEIFQTKIACRKAISGRNLREIIKSLVDVIDTQGALVSAQAKGVQSRVIVGCTESHQRIDQLHRQIAVVVFNDSYRNAVGRLRGLRIAAAPIGAGQVHYRVSQLNAAVTENLASQFHNPVSEENALLVVPVVIED